MGSSSPETRRNAENNNSRKRAGRPKKGPLPMKLRALPQSFWQQPNATDPLPPSACSPMPPLPRLEPEDTPSNLQVTPADVDLLFSLFTALPPSAAGQGRRPLVRRGRPRKNVDGRQKSTKDEDPYVTSAAVPEVKFQKEAMVESRVLALMAFNEPSHGPPLTDNSYAQRLQDLAINL